MKRREFIKAGLAAGAVTFLPSFTMSALANDYTSLPIPQLLTADKNGLITLRAQAGKTSWFGKPTTTWGVNGPLLGPALRMKRGDKVKISVENNLSENVALHWHGLEVPGIADGGPQAYMKPGQNWSAEFMVDQPASTCWFHPHTHGRTGFQVAMGLGGLIIIDDENSQGLALPSTWGVDDVPVVLQDKRFSADKQIDYELGVMEAAVGWFGDAMLVNGALLPKHTAPKGWLRLRFLNGCNSRSLRLSTSDNRPMYVIGSDGGLLAEPVLVRELNLYTGERFEVLVDASDGKNFDIVSLPVSQVGMTLPPFDQTFPVLSIEVSNEPNTAKLPDRLATIEALPALSGLPVRRFELSMNSRLDAQGMQLLEERFGKQAMAGVRGHHMMGGGHMMGNGMHGTNKSAKLGIFSANGINGQAFQMNTASFDVKQGQYEIWRVASHMHDMMLHPFHVHGTQFRILSENGQRPEVHRQGWKDIVLIDGGTSEILVKFDHLAPKGCMYMAHCHLLEHEDTGMMLSFTVSK